MLPFVLVTGCSVAACHMVVARGLRRRSRRRRTEVAPWYWDLGDIGLDIPTT